MGGGGGDIGKIAAAIGSSLPGIGPAIGAAAGYDGMDKGIKNKTGSGSVAKRTPDLAPGALQKKKSSVGTGEAPAFLSLAAGMTPEQQRAHIATQGVAGGGGGGFNDPEALKYYNQLALNTLIGDDGQMADPGDILPVERQFLAQLGYEPYEDSTESYLSALDRALGG